MAKLQYINCVLMVRYFSYYY